MWIWDSVNNCLDYTIGRRHYCVDYSPADNKWYAYLRCMPAEYFLGEGSLQYCIDVCESDIGFKS